MSDKVRIGVVGTSWWADAMYLPALTKHPLADVRSVVGGANRAHTREFADKWGIPGAYDTVEDLFAAEPLDALVVLTPNIHHHHYAMAAIERGLHVLCEKPLAMTSAQAREMAEAAERAGVITMVPFTYRFMPVNRYLKELVDEVNADPRRGVGHEHERRREQGRIHVDAALIRQPLPTLTE